MGPFPPAAQSGKQFLIVAVDYFTKWVEAEAVKKADKYAVHGFLWSSIFCRFGIPRSLVMDNGKAFDNERVRKLYNDYNLHMKFASVAHPMTNGQAEVVNRVILQHLKTRLDKKKGLWADELPGALWAYRTTPRRGTGETPFRLAFGVEAVIPVEIGIPTRRTAEYSEETNDRLMREELDLLEEVRDEAAIRVSHYQQKMAKYFNAKVKHRRLQVGDLVLRKSRFVRQPKWRKLSPNWEGPYIVKQEVYPGAYKLMKPDGSELPRTWNLEHLKKYYQ